jgi:hypothetical protein
MRRELPMILAFVSGLIFILAFFMPVVEPVSNTALQWYIVVAAFAMLIGAFNLLRINFMKVRLRRPDWPYSAVLILALAVMAVVGIVQGVDEGTVVYWLFQYLMVPMQSTMFALLAFFVASAAYRAFRARTAEATLLLVAALLVMLGQVPVGYAWYPDSWPSYLKFLNFDWLKDRIMEIGNTAGQRAILIGASLGVVSTSLRILLGIERSYLGED